MISFNITYYNEPVWLKWWYDTIININQEGLDVGLNIVDDGSMIDSAECFFEKCIPHPQMSLYCVVDDIGFNSHGARNLLMQQTKTQWNVLSDIDRQYSHKTIHSIINSEINLNRGNYYSFYETKKSSVDRFSVNDFLVHKEDFWLTGGYDEEFVNIHWGDRYFLDILKTVVQRQKVQQWEVVYVRGARNVVWDDNVTKTTYPDDETLIHPTYFWGNQEKRWGLKEAIKQRNRTLEGRASKPVINFEWTQIF